MVCPKCGSQNVDNAAVCTTCGNAMAPTPVAPQPVYMAPMAPAKVPGKGFGITSLVLGIIGIIGGFMGAWLYGLLAVIFGGVGLAKSKKFGVKNNFAIAGLVMGVIGLVLGIIIWAVVISQINEAIDTFNYYY